MTYNINNYNLFVFDLDGTIINTEIYHHLAWNAVLSIYMKKNINLSYNEYCKNFHINKKNNIIVPVLGEGSLQLNLQELQTIVHHKLPIKILVFNNNTTWSDKSNTRSIF
jgi:phosphoglycolate phosphatase-like HAD superfamily hydrolase